MPLVTLAEALAQAEKRNIAIAAFNIANYESLKAVMDTAVELRLPVIVQLFRRLFGDTKARELSILVKALAAETEFPVVMHLDHGKTIEQVEKAIEYGFTSVMIDASDQSMEDNIRITREVVSLAHPHGVSVEAELGIVPSQDNPEKSNFLTIPEDAERFVKETSVDALAVAIGTAHGKYIETPKLDLERLQAIRERVRISLVLHGGSGTPDPDVKKSISLGIRKINIATELHQAYIDGIGVQAEAHRLKFSPIDLYMQPVYEKMKSIVREKMSFFASA